MDNTEVSGEVKEKCHFASVQFSINIFFKWAIFLITEI